MNVTTIKNAKNSNVVVKRDNIRLRTIFTIASLLLSTFHLIVLIWSFFYIKYADEAKIVSIVAFVNFLVMSYDSITSRNVEIAKRILPVIGIPLNELNRIKEAIHQGIYFLTDICTPETWDIHIKEMIPRGFLILVALFFAYESHYLTGCGFSYLYVAITIFSAWSSTLLYATALVKKIAQLVQ